jgi:outer membrane protein
MASARGSLWIAAVSLVLLVAVCPGASAQEARIAYITSWKIIGPESTFQPVRDAEAAMNRDIESWNRELEDLQQEITEAEQELGRQRLVMTESQLREREQQLLEKKAELERRTREIWGQGGLIERRNAELVQPIRDKLLEASERGARDQG